MYQRSLPLRPDGEILPVEPLPDGKKYLESAKMKSGGMSRIEVKCSIPTFEMRSLAPSFGTTLVFFFTRNLFTNLGHVEHMRVRRPYRDLQAAILVSSIGRYLSEGLVWRGSPCPQRCNLGFTVNERSCSSSNDLSIKPNPWLVPRGIGCSEVDILFLGPLSTRDRTSVSSDRKDPAKDSKALSSASLYTLSWISR